MPRGKTFDPAEKIDEAVDLFWRRGCDAVSIQDLVETLGLNRGSLYDTYGGKEQLWLRALARYCELRNARLAGLLDGSSGPLLPRLRDLLTEIAGVSADGPRGCLVVNAVTERTTDPATREFAVRQINHVEDVLHQALEQAHAAGEIPAASSPRKLARFLVVMLQGLHVYDRATDDPGPARDAIDVAMAAILASDAAALPASG
jgi:TetR/AcrR family transcriptional regulator, transcriptional repressor for nem operon